MDTPTNRTDLYGYELVGMMLIEAQARSATAAERQDDGVIAARTAARAYVTAEAA